MHVGIGFVAILYLLTYLINYDIIYQEFSSTCFGNSWWISVKLFAFFNSSFAVNNCTNRLYLRGSLRTKNRKLSTSSFAPAPPFNLASSLASRQMSSIYCFTKISTRATESLLGGQPSPNPNIISSRSFRNLLLLAASPLLPLTLPLLPLLLPPLPVTPPLLLLLLLAMLSDLKRTITVCRHFEFEFTALPQYQIRTILARIRVVSYANLCEGLLSAYSTTLSYDILSYTVSLLTHRW
jgi:hypothetical protein